MKALIEQWHTEYDYIIFDTPPALSVTDAVVLSSACEVVVLVAKSGITTRQSLSRAHDLFERSRPRVLGVVVNGLEPGSPYYSSYYGYDNNSELNAGYYAPIAQ
jgi:Mrp family chromosome partitioning ATPase